MAHPALSANCLVTFANEIGKPQFDEESDVSGGLTWIRQKHVTAFLRNLAVAPEITHESFDALPDSRTREYVRGLLTEHGVLPQRDELRTRYDNWAAEAIERLSDPQNREVIRRCIRWHHQRRMNHMEEVTRGTFLRAKQEVTVAIDLLNWLPGLGIKLPELQQSHLDVWQAKGPQPGASPSASSNGPSRPKPPHPGSPSFRTAAAPAQTR